MPAYKRQHYLPTVYLKQFSSDKSILSRKSRVWRTDENGSRIAPVESECRSDYFYSKKDPKSAETLFHGLENLYPSGVSKVRSEAEPNRDEHFSFMLMMFDLHLRNAAYENRTGSEGIEAYNVRVNLFKRELLLHRTEGEPSEDECLRCLRDHWRVRIVTAPTGIELLTSDNPSLWFTTRPNGGLHFAILPITPRFCAVAFDQRAVQAVSATTSDEERTILNLNQC